MILSIESVELEISMLRRVGKLEEARAVCQFYLSRLENQLGQHVSEKLTLLHRLGDVLHEQKSLDAAYHVKETTRLERRIHLGELHVDTLKTAANFGNLLSDIGKTREAKALLRHVYSGFLSTLGPEHFYTLKSLQNMLIFLRANEMHEEAYIFLEQDLRRRLERFTPNNELHTTRLDPDEQKFNKTSESFAAEKSESIDMINTLKKIFNKEKRVEPARNDTSEVIQQFEVKVHSRSGFINTGNPLFPEFEAKLAAIGLPATFPIPEMDGGATVSAHTIKFIEENYVKLKASFRMFEGIPEMPLGMGRFEMQPLYWCYHREHGVGCVAKVGLVVEPAIIWLSDLSKGQS